MSPRNTLIVVGVLIVLVLGALSLNSRPGEGVSWPEKGLMEITASLQQVVIGSAQSIEKVWLDYFYLVNTRHENEQLYNALTKAKGRLNQLREAKITNERLNRLLKTANTLNNEYIGAQVVAWSPGAWFKTMIVNRGRRDGIRAGMPVVSEVGAVGRVIDVSPRFAKILLVIDYHSNVDAIIQRNRLRGMLSGRSEKTCDLKYILKNDDLLQGDIVVTSGMDGVFPKGIPLGTVNRVNPGGQDIFLDIDVTPAVDFNHLEEVLILMVEQPPF